MKRFQEVAIAAVIIIMIITILSSGISANPERGTPTPDTVTRSAAEMPAEPEPERNTRYADIDISENDIDTLARLVWYEARGESFEGQRAVVEVVLNRVKSEARYFPDTVQEVVYQKTGRYWQFPPAPYLQKAKPGEEQFNAVREAIYNEEYIVTEETVFFATKPYNEHITAIIGNHYFCSAG